MATSQLLPADEDGFSVDVTKIPLLGKLSLTIRKGQSVISLTVECLPSGALALTDLTRSKFYSRFTTPSLSSTPNNSSQK